MCLKITHLKLQPHLPGANELIAYQGREEELKSDTPQLQMKIMTMEFSGQNLADFYQRYDYKTLLTPWSLVMPYADIDLCQHWLR